jgi:pimeloyl-ACP methyl ester carboxylesterase
VHRRVSGVRTTVELPDGRLVQTAEGGDADGAPVFVHHGSPGSAILDPLWNSDAAARGLRLIAYARPGYGRSTRAVGRVVGDAARDVAAIADALGIERFLSWGASGGGPHALACAALLPDRLVAVASLAAVAPFDGERLDFFAGMGPGNIEEFGIAVNGGEAAIRPLAVEQAAALKDGTQDQMVEAMAPHLSPVDAAALRGPIGATVLAHFQDAFAVSVDGWVDDDLAFIGSWGFQVSDISVPVLLWQGRQDLMVPFGHGEWLAGQIHGVDARLTEQDGHLTLLTHRIPEVHQWLRDRWDAEQQ